jgi:hypothetical protein
MGKRNKLERCRPEFIRIVSGLRERQVDVDRLPYTEAFEERYDAFVERSRAEVTRSDFFWQLMVVRKNYRRLAEKYAAG